MVDMALQYASKVVDKEELYEVLRPLIKENLNNFKNYFSNNLEQKQDRRIWLKVFLGLLFAAIIICFKG